MTEYVTKIKGLTPANVAALREAEAAGMPIFSLGATYVVFAGDEDTALALVQADMDNLRGGAQPVRETRYQALIAVRNKLRNLSHHVSTYPVATAVAELTAEQYLEEIDRLRRELPGNHGADAFLLGWTAGHLTGAERAAAIEGARAEFAGSLAREAARREQKVAGVVAGRSDAEAGAELAGERECEAPEPAAVSNHTTAQAPGPLPSLPVRTAGEAEAVAGLDRNRATAPDVIELPAPAAVNPDAPVPVRLTIDLDVNPKMWALAFGVEGPEVLDDVATYVQNLLQCCAVVAEECWPADTVRVGAEIRDTE